MVKTQHYIYPDTDTLAATFVCEFSKFLKSAADFGKPMHVALSGGSTPLLIFRKLKEATVREEWSQIRLYWGDERCVPPGDPQSNYGNARKTLIDPLKLPGEHIFRMKCETDPVSEARRYGDLLKEKLPVENGVPVFDWIWLGMGEDGHTASIFPDQLELWNAAGPCVVAKHPRTGQKRITLTGHVINAAKRVSFLVSGKGKAPVVREVIMKEDRSGEYPASLVDPVSRNLEWFMDQDAASLL
ncbi:MAG: 6-phosphogluconolactonase [Bacteroidales bacterium]|nr:6-phosphogluconolactonase [Bacteroidales bacterium]